MGAGYDAATEDPTPASYVPAATSPNNKGRGIYVINGVDGTLIKHINVSGMGSMAADLTVIDRNNDGYFDRIYAADTTGNIWRVDIDNADPSKWAVVQLASLGGTSGTASGRKFLNKPDVVFGADFDAVLVGSGDREQPFETTVANRFYMVKDKYIGLTGGFICSSAGVGRACEEADLYAVTGTYATDKSATITNGWYKALRTGEKTVGNAVTVGGMTYFGTNTPIAAESGVCSSNLGEARLYSVNFQNATPPVSMNKDSTTTVLADYIGIPGGGFPPSPVYARVIVDGKPVDVLCTGSKCLPPPGVTTTSKRSRTYWYTKR
jgi:type IV pilus assembly protein PilY1